MVWVRDRYAIGTRFSWCNSLIINSGTRGTRFFHIFCWLCAEFEKMYIYRKVGKWVKIDVSRTRFLGFLYHKCINGGYKCCEIFGMVVFRSETSRKFLAIILLRSIAEVFVTHKDFCRFGVFGVFVYIQDFCHIMIFIYIRL